MKQGFIILLLLCLTGLIVWVGGFVSHTPWAAEFTLPMQYFFDALVGLLSGLAGGYALRQQLSCSQSAKSSIRYMAFVLIFIALLPELPVPEAWQLRQLLPYRILLFGFAGIFFSFA